MKNRTFSVVIIDDQDECVTALRKSIATFPELEIYGVSFNATSAKKLILELKPDILFLDVEMPGQTGIEMLHEIESDIHWPMYVIFCTAYQRYLLDAMRASAFDFLLKPFTDDEFNLVVNRVIIKASQNSKADNFKNNLSDLMPCKKKFMLSTSTGFKFMESENILYFEYHSLHKTWNLHLTENIKKPLQLKRGLISDDILHLSKSFIQISQRHIINSDYLSCINDSGCLFFPPFADIRLKITRTYLNSLQDSFELI